MADPEKKASAKKTYPMIPANVWWRLRDQFQKTLPGTVTRSYLATVLGVDERTAANLLGPLRTVGLIDAHGKPTERANHWRFDQDYPTVCEAIRDEVYPEELRQAVPDPKSNRDAALRWFMRTAGVGQAGATKMVATYQLVSDTTPKKSETGAPQRPARSRPQKQVPPAAIEPKPAVADKPPQLDVAAPRLDQTEPGSSGAVTTPTLHIDINVHISSDASADQIDQIFASMARHLYRQK
jgi:hypothetical protein